MHAHVDHLTFVVRGARRRTVGELLVVGLLAVYGLGLLGIVYANLDMWRRGAIGSEAFCIVPSLLFGLYGVWVMARNGGLVHPATVVKVFAARVEIDGVRVPYATVVRCEREQGVTIVEAGRRFALPDPDGAVHDALQSALATFEAEQAGAPEASAERERLARLQRGGE